jgi:polar amino acid transport system substrate-binding protein
MLDATQFEEKDMKRVLFIACLLAALISISCMKDPVAMQIYTEDYPPISYAQGDSITGYATDVVRALQKKVKSTEVIQLTTWSDAYEKALNQPNVILFSMEQTPARKELFNWIGPLGENTASFYVRSDSDLQLDNAQDAKKLESIATTSSWFTDQFLRDQGFENLISYADPLDNIKQVMKGTAQATILTDLTAPALIEAAGYTTEDLKPLIEVMKTKFYIAISKKTDPKRVAKWEKAFAQLAADGSLAKIQSKWLIR